MRIRVESKLAGDFDGLVVGVFSDDNNNLSSLDDKTRDLVNRLKENGFAGKPLETDMTLYPDGGPAKRLMVVGMGKMAEFDVMLARRVAGTGARQLRKKGAKKLAFALPAGNLDVTVAAQASAEGIVFSTFDAAIYRTGEGRDIKILDDVVFVGGDSLKDAVARGAVIGEGANFARGLAHEPANNMYPARMAEEAENVAKEFGLDFHALDKAQLTEGGFKAILAVGQGSAHEPRMIVLKYKGADDNAPWFGIVGKGITFDSGGLDIKPADGMESMKGDMSGGAWVLGTMRILAQLKPKVNVIGIVAAAENMPSGTAYRPGDVIGSLEGKNIEVLNTDAEGRIVLADGLAYARKLGATRLVDLATLTGACVVALGGVAAGVFGNDDAFIQQFLETSKAAGERSWNLPLFPEYREQITSTIADIINTGGRAAGASTAAAFLKEFTGGVPWIHLDIAGSSASNSETSYIAKGSNGHIIRTLVDFVTAHSEA